MRLSALLWTPRLIFAHALRFLARPKDRPRRTVGIAGTGHIHLMGLLPRLGRVRLVDGRRVDHVMDPRVPIGCDLRCIGELGVDDPTPGHAHGADALLLFVVFVAKRIGAHESALIPQR